MNIFLEEGMKDKIKMLRNDLKSDMELKDCKFGYSEKEWNSLEMEENKYEEIYMQMAMYKSFVIELWSFWSYKKLSEIEGEEYEKYTDQLYAYGAIVVEMVGLWPVGWTWKSWVSLYMESEVDESVKEFLKGMYTLHRLDYLLMKQLWDWEKLEEEKSEDHYIWVSRWGWLLKIWSFWVEGLKENPFKVGKLREGPFFLEPMLVPYLDSYQTFYENGVEWENNGKELFNWLKSEEGELVLFQYKNFYMPLKLSEMVEWGEKVMTKNDWDMKKGEYYLDYFWNLVQMLKSSDYVDFLTFMGFDKEGVENRLGDWENLKWPSLKGAETMWKLEEKYYKSLEKGAEGMS